jgi:hypothetical protein
MLVFHLFRIQIYHPSGQDDLLEKHLKRSQVLANALRELPSIEGQRKTTWLVGNLEPIKRRAFYFRLGRISKATMHIYKNGRFRDQVVEGAASYTHALAEIRKEILAIAEHPELARNVLSLASHISKLLNSSKTSRIRQVVFDVKPISDPNNFINAIRTSHAIKRFSVQFRRPNAFDANQDFLLPMQRLVASLDGSTGKTQVSGSHLDSNTIEEIARSAAATGDDASALVQPESSGRSLTVHLKGTTASTPQAAVETKQEKMDLLEKVVERYEEIRGRGDNG